MFGLSNDRTKKYPRIESIYQMCIYFISSGLDFVATIQ